MRVFALPLMPSKLAECGSVRGREEYQGPFWAYVGEATSSLVVEDPTDPPERVKVSVTAYLNYDAPGNGYHPETVHALAAVLEVVCVIAKDIGLVQDITPEHMEIGFVRIVTTDGDEGLLVQVESVPTRAAGPPQDTVCPECAGDPHDGIGYHGFSCSLAPSVLGVEEGQDG